jgi:hypothetical protein
MKAATMVGVGVLAAATVVVSATAGGGHPVRLPLPQAAMDLHHAQTVKSAGAGSSSAGAVPPGNDPSASASDTGADQPTIYTTPPAVVLTGCSVSVSNPAPLRGQTAETATVATTAGAEVRLEADYAKTRSRHDSLADDSGTASFALTITHAPPGVTVPVTATVSLRGAKYSCSTSFTPVDPVEIFPSGGGQ